MRSDNNDADEGRPLPTPNAFSAPFWKAAKGHQLSLQRCDDCQLFRFYPRPRCPQCQSARATWTIVSGQGVVYSYTIVHRPLTKWFNDKVPLVCAVIELEEGVRMMSNIEEIAPSDVTIGMPVSVQFEDVDEVISLPKFVPSALK